MMPMPAPMSPPADQLIRQTLTGLNRAIKPDVAQLGLWDAEQQQFLSLPELELRERATHGRRIHVIVHGWQPKAAGLVEEFRGTAPALTAWDERLVVDGKRLNQYLDRFAAAFTATGPEAVVLAFSWLEDAATQSPEEAIALTRVNAGRLVATLNTVAPKSWRTSGGRIHLFGHSAGARLICIAAGLMNPPPEHVTLSDAPEVSFPSLFTPADLNYLVLGNAIREGRLRIGRGLGETFIDNYISALGIPYSAIAETGAVVDVDLDPVGISNSHGYGNDWYTRAAAAGVGFGPAWSPLLEGVTPASSYYKQTWRTGDNQRDDSLEFDLTPQPPAPRLAVFHTDPGLQTLATDGPVVMKDGPRLLVEAPGYVLWTGNMNVSDDDRALVFDYLFDDFGTDTAILVWVEEQLRFVSSPPDQDISPELAASDGKWQRALVGLSNIGAGNKRIRIGIRNPSGTVRLEAFTKLSLPGLNPTFRPGLDSLLAISLSDDE